MGFIRNVYGGIRKVVPGLYVSLSEQGDIISQQQAPGGLACGPMTCYPNEAAL